MKVIIHAGAFATDNGMLLKCVKQNAKILRSRRVIVPESAQYRKLLSKEFVGLENYVDPNLSQETLYSAIFGKGVVDPTRVILSHKHFFGLPKHSIEANQLFPRAVTRLANLQQTVAPYEVELFLAVRNFATWLPELAAVTPQKNVPNLIGNSRPDHLFWSELIERLREAFPEIPITLWCNEDSPLIWGEIIRAMIGLPSGKEIDGSFEKLSTIMTREGMERLYSYISENTSFSENQRQRVMAAFLEKYSIKEAMEESLDVPGWTAEFIEELNISYERDIEYIETLPGVRLLTQ